KSGLSGWEDDIPGTATVTDINRSLAPFEPSTVEYHNWQGGGGYGDPIERDPDAVCRDDVALAVSAEVALNVYGVAVHDGAVDVNATEARREAIRAERRTARPARDQMPALIDETSAEFPVANDGMTTYGDL